MFDNDTNQTDYSDDQIMSMSNERFIAYVINAPVPIIHEYKGYRLIRAERKGDTGYKLFRSRRTNKLAREPFYDITP